MFSSVACLAVLYFSTSSYKVRDFREKSISERKTCVLIFSSDLSEACAIIGRIRRYIIITVHSLRVNCLLFF